VKYRYCFIITYGRSGSTLLQGVLNSIPGYVIRGENGGALSQLHKIAIHSEFLRTEFETISRHPQDPWYGIGEFESSRFAAYVRTLMVANFIRPPGDARCVGFKEIRYDRKSVPALDDFLLFVEKVFPDCCFIFNVRNLRDVANSGWWSEESDVLAYLADFEARMWDAYNRRQGNAFWVRYDDYVGSPVELRPLFDFLGEPFDFDAVASIMNLEHSA
jgi:hypothetical protein